MNHTREELQGPFRYPATSVAIELGAPLRRQDLMVLYLQQLEKDYDRFIAKGFWTLLPELEAASATIGKTIEIHRGDVRCEGKALGFTTEGALRLLRKDGEEETIWVGDVSLVEGGLQEKHGNS